MTVAETNETDPVVQSPLSVTEIDPGQLNQAQAPVAVGQTEDADFLRRKLELERQDRLRVSQNNKALNEQLQALQAQYQAFQEKTQEQQTANLEKQGQYRPLWEDAQQTIASLKATITQLEGQLSTEKERNSNEKLQNEALSLLAQQGVTAPDQLLTILQAKQGLRRGETGAVEVIVGGASTPLADQLQAMRRAPEWQHHFSASGARGMGAGPTATSRIAPGTTNPWRAETRNWTQQILLEQQNPELAAAFKAEAARGG